MPIPSCITFTLEDISLADAGSFIVGRQTFNLSGVAVKRVYTFNNFTVPKPIEKDLHDQFAIRAQMMFGCCFPDSNVQYGDWYTDTSFYVSLNNKTDVYEDIVMNLIGKLDICMILFSFLTFHNNCI